MTTNPKPADSPASLVAIIRAAHAVGDRDLERSARELLRQQFGMEVKFIGKHREEVCHAS